MKSFILLMTLITSVSSFAENCGDYGSTAEIHDCQLRNLRHVDSELNANYQALLKSEDDEGKKKLRDAQRAWMTYRDANCEYAADEMRGGTGARLIRTGCLVEMSEVRSQELKNILNSRI